MGWTNGIDAITLFVDDLDTSKAFYGSVFDLPVMFEDGASAVFDFRELRGGSVRAVGIA
jgi:catechol 2,3-dioxygenase-like lactoylglutathione lyase family enzyme